METHTLETHIYRLRQKMEDEPDSPQRLVTIENGYKIISDYLFDKLEKIDAFK